MRFLQFEGIERVAAQVVLQRAEQLTADEETKRMQRIERAVQNGVARAFGAR